MSPDRKQQRSLIDRVELRKALTPNATVFLERAFSEPELGGDAYETLAGLFPEPNIEAIGRRIGYPLKEFPDGKGKGNTRSVFLVEEDPAREPTKVAKIDKFPVTPEQAKNRFHRHGIYHELSPHSIPKMFDSQSTEDGSFTVMERIIPDNTIYEEHPFEKIVDLFEKEEIPFDLDYKKSSNFYPNSTGEYYIDELNVETDELLNSQQRILDFMTEQNYKVDAQTRVKEHFQALREEHELAA